MLVGHGQIYLKILAISLIRNDWVEVRVLQVEIHDGVPAAQAGEMSKHKAILTNVDEDKDIPGSLAECKPSDDGGICFWLKYIKT